MRKEDLTVHSVVKNEPFIYYAIKSVYDYCGTILLYDTGSDDEYTIQDIERLISEDTENKIIYKQSLIEYDESRWTTGNYWQILKENEGKKGVKHVRQEQIDDTKTPYFMIVDGDEVHYASTMLDILNYDMPASISMLQIPLLWFNNLNETVEVYSPTGRIFRTDDIEVTKGPGDTNRSKTGQNLISRRQVLSTQPFAHFEPYLKPFRRDKRQLLKTAQVFNKKLPEVMIEEPYFIERYEKLIRRKELESYGIRI